MTTPKEMTDSTEKNQRLEGLEAELNKLEMDLANGRISRKEYESQKAKLEQKINELKNSSGGGSKKVLYIAAAALAAAIGITCTVTSSSNGGGSNTNISTQTETPVNPNHDDIGHVIAASPVAIDSCSTVQNAGGEDPKDEDDEEDLTVTIPTKAQKQYQVNIDYKYENDHTLTIAGTRDIDIPQLLEQLGKSNKITKANLGNNILNENSLKLLKTYYPNLTQIWCYNLMGGYDRKDLQNKYSVTIVDNRLALNNALNSSEEEKKMRFSQNLAQVLGGGETSDRKPEYRIIPFGNTAVVQFEKAA